MPDKATSARPGRKDRNNTLRRLILKSVRWFMVLMLIALGAAIGLFGALYYSLSNLVPQRLGNLENQVSEATRIYSSDGVLLARLYEQDRQWVDLEDIPVELQQATIAVEDRRFRSHHGFDVRGMARAAVANVRGRGYEQGASTITQQLARNIYLSRKKTIARKFQELTLAIALERRYSKDQILEAYLNQVYYGGGAYGIHSAARIYFRKSLNDLSLGQMAMLAGLPQRPSSNSPFENLDAAIRRRNVVLSKMAEEGFINDEEANEARESEIQLAQRPTNLQWKAPYFVTYVKKLLSEEYGETMLYQAGLRVYTTLDWSMQQAAEAAVRNGVAGNRYRGVGQAALVSVDPRTGYIRAMVGGKSFEENQFNVTTQGRPQAGSTFKIFVYTAALENGFTPRDTIKDEPVLRERNKPPWPKNYTNRYSYSRMTLSTALAQSTNTVAAKLAKTVGVDEVMTYARAMGIQSALPEGLSLALGSASVTPLEMARAYGVIANGGDAVPSVAVTKITTSDGGNLYTAPVKRTRVITQNTAEEMDRMLRGVTTRGTGTLVGRQIAEARGKTGTTDEDRHVWFIGYTPELVTAVWAGNDIPVPLRNRASGAGVCGPMWVNFMSKAVPEQRKFIAAKPHLYQSAPEQTAERPTTRPRRTRPAAREAEARYEQVTLSICDVSGLIARPSCPSTHSETFDKSFAPSVRCDIHVQSGGGETDDGGSGDSNETAPSRPTPPTPVSTPRNTSTTAPAQPQYVTSLICADSGLIASTSCPHVVRKRFRADLTPTQVCGRH